MDAKKMLNLFNRKANEWLVDLRMMGMKRSFKSNQLKNRSQFQRYTTML